MSDNETFVLLLEINANVAQAVTALQNLQTGMGHTMGGVKSLGDAFAVAAGVMIRDFVRGGLDAVVKASTQASDNFKAYELTLTKIAAASGVVGNEAKKLSAEFAGVVEAQTDLGYSGREASLALEALVKAGMHGADASVALRSALMLARVEGIATSDAANLLVATLTQFHLKASEAADALTLISKAADSGIDTAANYAAGLSNAGAAAASMGFSLQETLATLVILDKTYKSATESGTFLNMFFKDLITKSDSLALSLYNTDGSMRSLSEIVEQLQAKVASFGGNQQAINEYLSVFDIRAQRAVVALINYDGSISDVIQHMDHQNTIQDKTNMIMETTAGKTAKLNSEIENASIELGKMTANLQLTWKEFALGLGPIGAVADGLGPTILQGAITGVMVMLPTLWTSLKTTSIELLGVTLSAQTVAIAITAAVGAFTVVYGVLQMLPDDVRPVVAIIVALTASLVAATVVAAAFWGTISLGVAVPVILLAVGAAVAGVMVAMQSASSAADEFSGAIGGTTGMLRGYGDALKGIVDETNKALVAEKQHYTESLEAEDKRYADGKAALNLYFTDKYSTTVTEEARLLDVINQYYDQAFSDAQKAYGDQLDALSASFDEKWGTTETDLTRLEDRINQHYDEQVQKVTNAANDEIRAVNAMYDELIAITNAGLMAIRNERDADMDALELWYLKGKAKAKENYEAGIIDKNAYESEISELESAYRTQRGEMSDAYRIRELEAELVVKEEEKRLAQERADAILVIETKSQQDSATINMQRNADLQRAALETEAIIAALNDVIVALESGKNADIAKAKASLENLTRIHAENIENITRDSMNNQTAITQSGLDAQAGLWAKYFEEVRQKAADMITNFPTLPVDIWQPPTSTQPVTPWVPPASTPAPAPSIPINTNPENPPYMPVEYWYQHGGIAKSPQVAMVAEKEPEAIIPLSKLDSILSPRQAQPNITVLVDVHGNSFASAIDIQREFDKAGNDIVRKIRNRTGYLAVG